MGCHPSKISENHIAPHSLPTDQQHLSEEDTDFNDNLETEPKMEKKDKSKGGQSTEKIENERKHRFSELQKNIKLIKTPNSKKDSNGRYTESFKAAVSDISEVCTSVLILETFSKEEKET